MNAKRKDYFKDPVWRGVKAFEGLMKLVWNLDLNKDRSDSIDDVFAIIEYVKRVLHED